MKTFEKGDKLYAARGEGPASLRQVADADLSRFKSEDEGERDGYRMQAVAGAPGPKMRSTWVHGSTMRNPRLYWAEEHGPDGPPQPQAEPPKVDAAEVAESSSTLQKVLKVTEDIFSLLKKIHDGQYVIVEAVNPEAAKVWRQRRKKKVGGDATLPNDFPKELLAKGAALDDVIAHVIKGLVGEDNASPDEDVVVAAVEGLRSSVSVVFEKHRSVRGRVRCLLRRTQTPPDSAANGVPH